MSGCWALVNSCKETQANGCLATKGFGLTVPSGCSNITWPQAETM